MFIHISCNIIDKVYIIIIIIIIQKMRDYSCQGISCTTNELFCPQVVLCGTWSETSVAPSQLTQFWQIPRHRTISYFLCTPFFVTTIPQRWNLQVRQGPQYKKTLRDSLPIDMLLSAMSILVVAQSSSGVLDGLMNNPVCWQYFSKYFLFCQLSNGGIKKIEYILKLHNYVQVDRCLQKSIFKYISIMLHFSCFFIYLF